MQSRNLRWLAAGAGAASLAGMTSAAGPDLPGRALAAGKPARHAVVWLEAPGAPRTPPRGRVVMDQRNLTFLPHVLAIQVGTTVEFPNNDRVFHNVFSFRDGKRFDLGLYPVGAVKKVKFDQPGLSRLYCNIHPKMAAYIMCVDSPYFAVADREGRFVLRDVPAGAYTFRAWRPGGEVLTGRVEARSGRELPVEWP